MSGGAPAAHRAYAPGSLGCAVLTVSDSRTTADDSSGQAIRERLEAAGHRVVEHSIVSDDREAIQYAVLRALAGTAGRKAVFVLPGSSGAVKLGLERLIVPELGHLVGQLRRGDAAPSAPGERHRK